MANQLALDFNLELNEIKSEKNDYKFLPQVIRALEEPIGDSIAGSYF